jgi:hypothetical protein
MYLKILFCLAKNTASSLQVPTVNTVYKKFCFSENHITARLTFLAPSFCMSHTVQGPSWFECCENGKEELLRTFTLCWIIGVSFVSLTVSQWALICYMFWLHAINVAWITFSLGVLTARHLWNNRNSYGPNSVIPLKSDLITYFNIIPPFSITY